MENRRLVNGIKYHRIFTSGIFGNIFVEESYRKKPRPSWLRPFHWITGTILVILILILLSIGLMGTIGYYGSLGHSWHLPAGLTVVTLVLLSAWTSTQIHPSRPWARKLHVNVNIALFFALLAVGLTGLFVVQKYLP